ncbi:AfsA-related hotdog domain-containing protein [Streptomyces luteolus]|uniref:AfsA-related hotdog domain-containing protein n=1 Tax=Streptomyces luteolus TaxID=3043615 RepID=A0ABT6T113_9ACTN|nr:AfsA-related hotdog domain-containing protein [Streptomyces sp. B-S-A12]MDI3420597.1 AfsA-related hotdog domain-containing protein [Streptomyces sp. B-S-A12]
MEASVLDAPRSPTTPAYDRTVSRALVHRWALSEVFLTDSVATGEGTFTAAAQLPLSHGYFRDHAAGRSFHDPLLVLESCRQAVTYASHLHEEVPQDTTFMVTSWTLDITEPEALRCGERPGELRMDAEVTQRGRRGGRLRRLAFAMDLTLDGRTLGRLTMDTNCTPTDQYHALRHMQRGTTVPTAFTLPAEPAGVPVDPARVRRLDPANTVLDAVQLDPGTLTARLSPRTHRNRSMYDHPYDHVPAMVFSEAARQCALLLGVEDTVTPQTDAGRVLRLHGRFLKFAELDDAVCLTAAREGDGGQETFRMSAVQQDETVAEVRVALG